MYKREVSAVLELGDSMSEKNVAKKRGSKSQLKISQRVLLI